VQPYEFRKSRGPSRDDRLRRRSRRFFPLITLAALFATLPQTYAQDSPSPALAPQEKLARREISISVGVTFVNPYFIETVQPGGKGRLELINLRLDRRFWSPWKISMRRSLGITPVAVFSRHLGGQHVFTYGAGVSAGAEITTKSAWRVQPYLDGGIGFLVFAQPAPVPDSRRFNFDFYFGSGFGITTSRTGTQPPTIPASIASSAMSAILFGARISRGDRSQAGGSLTSAF
jgi:hypothetical protein